MDTNVKWFRMPIGVQLSNVGSEVNRAIRWKNRNDKQKAAIFCKKAIEYLGIIRSDPKNIHRKEELNEAINELQDYFMGENIYQATEEVLMRYYDSFLGSTLL